MIAPALVVLAFALPGLRGEPDSPLATTAVAGRTEEVRRLIQEGADVHHLAGAGFTAFAWAARAGQIEAMHILKEAGAPLDAQDQGVNGWTPIMHALHKDQTKAALALLEWGADPDASSRNGTTPLMRAACENEPEVVRALLDRGADPHRTTHDGDNVLVFAVHGGNADIVRMVLQAAPDLRLGDSPGSRLARFVARLRGKDAVLDAIRDATVHPAEPEAKPQG